MSRREGVGLKNAEGFFTAAWWHISYYAGRSLRDFIRAEGPRKVSVEILIIGAFGAVLDSRVVVLTLLYAAISSYFDHIQLFNHHDSCYSSKSIRLMMTLCVRIPLQPLVMQ